MDTAVINVDFSKEMGKIKPMHGVGQPPFVGMEFKMFRYLTEAGIPFSRLHDTGGWFGGSRYVDIPNLFPDSGADPGDPDSYDFAFTDRLITALVNAGAEPFFRLGVTIENYAHIKAYRIFRPPTRLNGQRSARASYATTRRDGQTASISTSPTGRYGTSQKTG